MKPILHSSNDSLPTGTTTVLDEDTRSPAEIEAGNDARSVFSRLWRDHAAVGFVTLITIALVLVTGLIALRVAEQQIREDEQARLLTERLAISATVDRLRHLPIAIANHPHVISLLQSSPRNVTSAVGPTHGTPMTTQRVNEYLSTVGAAAQSSLLYVMDVNGLTRAASNWASEESLVGIGYPYRPYFQEAIRGADARYFAVGVTTGEAGYFAARPVRSRDSASIIGIAVAKIELETLQSQWESVDRDRLLIDRHGVTILASRSEWRHRATRPLSAELKDRFRQQRKYANHPLTELTSNGEINGSRLRLDGTDYLVNSVAMTPQDWRLIYLTPLASVQRIGALSALAALLLCGITSLVLLYVRERRRKNRLSLAANEARRMRVLNRQLGDEVSERRRVEQSLRDAQAELIQTSKLAALGQMSAAIAHEVNQPLSAIRTYSASARLLLDRDRVLDVDNNLREIEDLTERLAIVTTDLKVFARKSDEARDPISLQAALHSVTGHLRAEMDAQRIDVKMVVPQTPYYVLGAALRLEQVIRNLMRNGLDAMADKTADEDEIHRPRCLSLSVSATPRHVVLEVSDTGPGIEETVIDQLFDPFFTTKPLGQGLGLGLALSHGIVQEMGGTLRASNRAGGGASFTVQLPRVGESHVA